MKLIIFFITTAILLRVIPHVPNFAPVTAIALFGGAYLSKKTAITLPLLIMIVSDYLLLYINPYGINFSRIHPISAMFYSATLFVWASFLISSLIGIWISKKKTISRIGIGAVLASLQFFIITNLGVWLTSGMYALNLDGLVQCYVMALPFFRGTFLGDLFYTGTFFGGFELAKYYSKKLNILKI